MKSLTAALRVLPTIVMEIAARFVRERSRKRRKTPASARRRIKLWNWFYGLDWGKARTNNYGFAPAEGEGPERFQHQLYAELLKGLRASGRLPERTDLLEISCGRGGGLAHLIRIWPGPIEATGLDVAASAVRACREAFRDNPDLRFVEGSALALPFADDSFDVVVNVEASNEYGDHEGFFREVRRVLRPSGALLYCDTRRDHEVAEVAPTLARAGLAGGLRDITDHVVQACEADGARRLAMMATAPLPLRLLFRKELADYAALPGSRRLEEFRARRRVYLMTCAVKAESA
jgi:SAM-dependent methyltransferase